MLRFIIVVYGFYISLRVAPKVYIIYGHLVRAFRLLNCILYGKKPTARATNQSAFWINPSILVVHQTPNRLGNLYATTFGANALHILVLSMLYSLPFRRKHFLPIATVFILVRCVFLYVCVCMYVCECTVCIYLWGIFHFFQWLTTCSHEDHHDVAFSGGQIWANDSLFEHTHLILSYLQRKYLK